MEIMRYKGEFYQSKEEIKDRECVGCHFRNRNDCIMTDDCEGIIWIKEK